MGSGKCSHLVADNAMLLQVSDAAHEARDNVKFLTTLDQSIAPLRTASLPELLDGLPALFASLHTLQNASRCAAASSFAHAVHHPVLQSECWIAERTLWHDVIPMCWSASSSRD